MARKPISEFRLCWKNYDTYKIYDNATGEEIAKKMGTDVGALYCAIDKCNPGDEPFPVKDWQTEKYGCSIYPDVALFALSSIRAMSMQCDFCTHQCKPGCISKYHDSPPLKLGTSDLYRCMIGAHTAHYRNLCDDHARMMLDVGEYDDIHLVAQVHEGCIHVCRHPSPAVYDYNPVYVIGTQPRIEEKKKIVRSPESIEQFLAWVTRVLPMEDAFPENQDSPVSCKKSKSKRRRERKRKLEASK